MQTEKKKQEITLYNFQIIFLYNVAGTFNQKQTLSNVIPVVLLTFCLSLKVYMYIRIEQIYLPLHVLL